MGRSSSREQGQEVKKKGSSSESRPGQAGLLPY